MTNDFKTLSEHCFIKLYVINSYFISYLFVTATTAKDKGPFKNKDENGHKESVDKPTAHGKENEKEHQQNTVTEIPESPKEEEKDKKKTSKPQPNLQTK